MRSKAIFHQNVYNLDRFIAINRIPTRFMIAFEALLEFVDFSRIISILPALAQGFYLYRIPKKIA
jgi:hypothetical protein